MPGVLGRIRTCGLSVRSAALYPLSYEDALPRTYPLSREDYSTVPGLCQSQVTRRGCTVKGYTEICN